MSGGSAVVNIGSAPAAKVHRLQFCSSREPDTKTSWQTVHLGLAAERPQRGKKATHLVRASWANAQSHDLRMGRERPRMAHRIIAWPSVWGAPCVIVISSPQAASESQTAGTLHYCPYVLRALLDEAGPLALYPCLSPQQIE